MSFNLIEKENNEIQQNIIEKRPNNEEIENNKIEEKKSNDNKLNNENTKNFNNKKIDLTLNNNFVERKEKFRVNRDIFKRLVKNKTQGELRNFRNTNYKRFYEAKNRDENALNNLSKFQLNMNQTFGYFDKEKIKNEIYNLNLEMKMLDEELNYLKEKEKEAVNKFMANKLIIEKVLNIKKNKEENETNEEKEKNNENVKNEENKNSNKNDKNNDIKGINSNFYLTQLVHSDITKDETKEDNINEEIPDEKNNDNANKNKNNKINKNKTMACIKKKHNFNNRFKYIKVKNRLKVNNFKRPAVTPKREVSDYDKSIESTSKLTESKKNDEKVSLFLSMNSFIDNKNKTLEDLYSKKNELLEVLNKQNQKICSIVLRTKKVTEEKKKNRKIY